MFTLFAIQLYTCLEEWYTLTRGRHRQTGVNYYEEDESDITQLATKKGTYGVRQAGIELEDYFQPVRCHRYRSFEKGYKERQRFAGPCYRFGLSERAG